MRPALRHGFELVRSPEEVRPREGWQPLLPRDGLGRDLDERPEEQGRSRRQPR